MENNLCRLYYLLNYNSENYCIVGVDDTYNRNKIGIWVKCKSCNELKYINIKNDSTKIIRCVKCGKCEIAIPIKDKIKSNEIVGISFIKYSKYKSIMREFNGENNRKYLIVKKINDM